MSSPVFRQALLPACRRLRLKSNGVVFLFRTINTGEKMKIEPMTSADRQSPPADAQSAANYADQNLPPHINNPWQSKEERRHQIKLYLICGGVFAGIFGGYWWFQRFALNDKTTPMPWVVLFCMFTGRPHPDPNVHFQPLWTEKTFRRSHEPRGMENVHLEEDEDGAEVASKKPYSSRKSRS